MIQMRSIRRAGQLGGQENFDDPTGGWLGWTLRPDRRCDLRPTSRKPPKATSRRVRLCGSSFGPSVKLRRRDGSYIRFDRNAAVLVDNRTSLSVWCLWT